MLRLIQVANSIPYSWPVDPSAEFQPGQIGQLNVTGNQIVCGVSDGRAPIGIIDDIKTKAFTAPAWNESITVQIDNSNTINTGGNYYTLRDVKVELKNPNIISSTFVSKPVDVQLISTNGVIVFPAGTQLNFDFIGNGTPNAIKTIVSYTYQIPNIIGDDSTQGSKRVTLWFTRLIAQTDMYETNQVYPVNANLFVSEVGLLTTRQPTPTHPAVALVTAPPSAILSFLEFMWL